jgi:DNA-binding CsgD family transcriptional regulator
MSQRQADVMRLVAGGCSDKQIAAQLGLSTGTVKTYLGRIYRYNGFRNRAEAAVAWSLQDRVVGSSLIDGWASEKNVERPPSENPRVGRNSALV